MVFKIRLQQNNFTARSARQRHLALAEDYTPAQYIDLYSTANFHACEQRASLPHCLIASLPHCLAASLPQRCNAAYPKLDGFIMMLFTTAVISYILLTELQCQPPFAPCS